MDTLKKVAVSGMTTVGGVYVLQNFLGMGGLPAEDTMRAAMMLGAVSGAGCVFADMVVSPQLAKYGL
jgi:hypothetical protein